MGILGDIATAVGTGYNIFQGVKNYQSQQENYAYQKALQQEIFNREDTSLQRRVADAEAAGLNPQLAISQGAGTGSVVGTSAPEMDIKGLDFYERILNNRAIEATIANAKADKKLKDEQSTLNSQEMLKNIQDHDVAFLTHIVLTLNLEYFSTFLDC